MTRIGLYNGSALLCAVALGAALTHRFASDAQARVAQVRPPTLTIEEVALPGGGRGLRDASGNVAPLGDYQRIASVSLVADQVLAELCEPERVIAVTQRSKDSPRRGHHYRHVPGLSSLRDLETILALDPDLILANHFGDPRYAARLREHGIVVFDLGEMRGLQTLLPNIRSIGALIGRPAEAAAMAARLSRRMRAVALDVPANGRPRALYLSLYGSQLFGGTRPTSYYDVIVHAGLIDAAADQYEGWPQLSSEQVLALAPEILVTKEGMGARLCQHPGLDRLGPCRGHGRIIELDLNLVDDPGPVMLELAESLHDQVYGPPAP